MVKLQKYGYLVIPKNIVKAVKLKKNTYLTFNTSKGHIAFTKTEFKTSCKVRVKYTDKAKTRKSLYIKMSELSVKYAKFIIGKELKVLPAIGGFVVQK